VLELCFRPLSLNLLRRRLSGTRYKDLLPTNNRLLHPQGFTPLQLDLITTKLPTMVMREFSTERYELHLHSKVRQALHGIKQPFEMLMKDQEYAHFEFGMEDP
jgi:hypothetical protein